MKKYAVLVAGGNGTRMNSVIPKQFLLLQDKPVLFYTIASFLEAFADIKIILVLPKDYLETGQEIVQKYFPNHSNIFIASGGETRFHSVQNGLKLVADTSMVFIHDAVRCLVTPNLIKSSYEEALKHGNAIPYVISRDSVRIIDNNKSEIIERNKIALIQTPQVFFSNIILTAFNIEYNPFFTDEASVVEASGVEVKLIPGEHTNIKITNPVDLIVADKLLSERSVR
jgi:2-C-methyl-D-erythritol 4-phosphate cytidylyltransferase